MSDTSTHEFITRLAPDATTAQLVDPGIPSIGEVGGDGTTMSWSLTPGSYDEASIALSWTRVYADSTRHTFVWSLILPAGMTSFENYPTLPAELDPFVMRTTDPPESFSDSYLTVVDFAEAADYDGARTLPEWVLTAPLNAAIAGDVGGVAVARNNPP